MSQEFQVNDTVIFSTVEGVEITGTIVKVNAKTYRVQFADPKNNKKTGVVDKWIHRHKTKHKIRHVG